MAQLLQRQRHVPRSELTAKLFGHIKLPEQLLEAQGDKIVKSPDELTDTQQKLLVERRAQKQQRNFVGADRLRDTLYNTGLLVRDYERGVVLIRVQPKSQPVVGALTA